MKPRNYFAVTLFFALLVCFSFQTLPVLGVNEVQAEEELWVMPTYDTDTVPEGNVYPDLGGFGYYDGYLFRTVECKIELFVNAEDVNDLLKDTGYTVFPPGTDEAKVDVVWIYRIFSQWPTNELGYESSTQKTIGSLHFGVTTDDPKNAGLQLTYFILADVRSPGDAVDMANATVGGGWAEVSREGDLKMEFESESKRNGKSTLKFKAKVKEPMSGLFIKVKATLPEGVEATRFVANMPNFPLQVVFMDLSKTPLLEGKPFHSWTQKDEYTFNDETEDFKLEVTIAGNELKLPGGHVLPIIRIGQSLLLRRNSENYIHFLDP